MLKRMSRHHVGVPRLGRAFVLRRITPNECIRIIDWEPMDLRESDCLIKTKQRECYAKVYTLCDFCPVL